jgi:hypothetical protein
VPFTKESAAAAGAKGGKSRSAAKRKASRRNGIRGGFAGGVLGGRPRTRTLAEFILRRKLSATRPDPYTRSEKETATHAFITAVPLQEDRDLVRKFFGIPHKPECHPPVEIQIDQDFAHLISDSEIRRWVHRAGGKLPKRGLRVQSCQCFSDSYNSESRKHNPSVLEQFDYKQKKPAKGKRVYEILKRFQKIARKKRMAPPTKAEPRQTMKG